MVRGSVVEDDARVGLEERDGEGDAAEVDGLDDAFAEEGIEGVDDPASLCERRVSACGR